MAGLEGLAAEWRALHRRSAAHGAAGYDWCRESWAAFAGPTRRLHIVTGRIDGELVLVWPMMVQRFWIWSLARPLGAETTEYSDVLVADGAEAQPRLVAAWRHLRRTMRADVIILPFLPRGSQLDAALEAARPLLQSHFSLPAPHVSFGHHADWASYAGGLKGPFRRELQRKRRRAAELGGLAFAEATDPAERAALIDWMLVQKRQWVIATGRRAWWLHSPKYRAFLLGLARQASEDRRLALFGLWLDGRLLAAEMSHVDSRRVEAFMGAFDRDAAALSPGQILQEDCLRWACERRLDYDFRIGEEGYKRFWLTRSRQVTTRHIANTPLGAPFLLALAGRASFEALRCGLRALLPPSVKAAIKRRIAEALQRVRTRRIGGSAAIRPSADRSAACNPRSPG